MRPEAEIGNRQHLVEPRHGIGWDESLPQLTMALTGALLSAAAAKQLGRWRWGSGDDAQSDFASVATSV
jgi:hypothetical protein